MKIVHSEEKKEVEEIEEAEFIEIKPSQNGAEV
jgi:hypothetical protein